MNDQESQRNYFNWGNRLFWIILIAIILIGFIRLADRAFNNTAVVERILRSEKIKSVKNDTIIVFDTLLVVDTIKRPMAFDSSSLQWKWLDYEGRWHRINFKIAKDDYEKSVSNRNSFGLEIFSPNIESLWGNMFEFDRPKLHSIVNAYKRGILANGYRGQAAMDYVVSSIQYRGYTFVSAGTDNSRCGIGDAPIEDCRSLNIGGGFKRGCCDNVKPFGVFSPLEFAYHSKGDCDTKALFAYTILKGLGYDNVFVLFGDTDDSSHAMLGVKVPSPPFIGHYVSDRDGRKIYPWEVTSGTSKLGMYSWNTFNNWGVGLR